MIQFRLLIFIDNELKRSGGFVFIHYHYVDKLVVTFQHIEKPTEDDLNNNFYSVVLCKWEQGQCQIGLEKTVDIGNELTYHYR